MRLSLPLAALVLFVAAPPSNAQLIFLKDGFILNGKVRKEQTTVVDNIAGEAYQYTKGYHVDDGPRRYYFAPTQMQRIDEAFVRPEDTAFFPRSYAIIPVKGHPGAIIDILEVTPWDEKWDRTFRFQGLRDNGGTWTLKQHLSTLSSHYGMAVSMDKIDLRACYLTQEMGPKVVRELLGYHRDFIDDTNLAVNTRLDRRFRLYHFLVHAGWLTEAGDELDSILRVFPGHRMRVEQAREKLHQLQAKKHFDDIMTGHRTGRHQWVRNQVSFFAEKSAGQKLLQDFRTFKASLDATDDKMKEIHQFLDDLLKGSLKQDEEALFRDAVPFIKAELHPDAIGRLELFVEQARSMARKRQMKVKVDLSDGELLSFAVSGWLLGNAAAECKFETSKRLWRGRKLALEYCATDAAGRGQLLAKVDTKELPSIDEMLLLLPTLPPIKPDEKLPQDGSEQKFNGTSYRLQLPNEYHAGRAYPVLLALHGGGEKAETILERLSNKAREEGYILAAPTWSNGQSYGFSAEEHQTVLDTLHDLRQRFNVDSDRVFLLGWGGGATMAYDVGMSHPDLFAGVMPMCGSPEWFARHYWANAQYLPFYSVSGDVMGPSSKQIRDLYEKWLQHGYPAIHAQYKGRGVEWFSGELPTMFDWMSRKRRAAPTTALGRFGQGQFGDEFVSFRPTDNRFYWITSDAMKPECINSVPGWKSKPPATLHGGIKPATNQVYVWQTGFKHLAIWLGRDARIDFEKPIVVRANGNIAVQGKIAPKLATLLEDFANRLDRQRLYVARIDVNFR